MLTWACNFSASRSFANSGRVWPAANELVPPVKEGGMLAYVNSNRIHVVPPCSISDEDGLDGLSVLDSTLTLCDAHASN